jgi:ankyrin repeat protein
MFAQKSSYRTLTVLACVAGGLILTGCPANNNGQTAAPASANTSGGTQAPPKLNPVTPTSPQQVANSNPNRSPYRSTSPLFEAVAAKDPQRVEQLLKAGENPNEYIQDGEYGAYTVMHTAARLGLADVIKILAKNGGEVNVQAVVHHKATPLHWAARANHIEAVTALIELGADVNAIASPEKDPSTPLRVALDRGFHDVAVVIRAYGGKEKP